MFWTFCLDLLSNRLKIFSNCLPRSASDSDISSSSSWFSCVSSESILDVKEIPFPFLSVLLLIVISKFCKDPINSSIFKLDISWASLSRHFWRSSYFISIDSLFYFTTEHLFFFLRKGGKSSNYPFEKILGSGVSYI